MADLKQSRESVFLMSSGRLFHNFGAADWNALSPRVTLHFTLAGTNSTALRRRRLYREAFATDNKSAKYSTQIINNRQTLLVKIKDITKDYTFDHNNWSCTYSSVGQSSVPIGYLLAWHLHGRVPICHVFQVIS